MSEPPIEPGEGEVLPTIGGWADAEVTGDRVNVFDAPIVAGDPAGARIEIRSTGFHAFNGTGTETAHIDGAEGVFVGGEFRTSDTLPGQVTLADDAYVSSYDGVARPGISVEPEDATRYSILPGVGPESVGMTIDGGKLTTGEFSYITMFPNSASIRSHRPGGTIGGEISARPTASLMRTYREDGTTGGAIQTTPTASVMRTYREDGTTGGEAQTTPTSSTMRTHSGNSSEQGWVRVRPQDAELAYVAPDNTYFSRIKTDASEAFLYTRAGGASRYLTVDADGIWASTNKGGSWKHYNLEETAQDSGWQPFTVSAGITGSADLAWRNKGGIIWFRGNVSGSWASGYQYLTGALPEEMRPQERVETMAVSRHDPAMMVRVHPSGRLDLWKPSAGSATIYLSGISYPLG